MECNKEEAFRAKSIAERKMQDKDFVGARKFALKAQQLYPDTENISRMICVCDVHCSAEKKIFGNELDWYGILQIELTADEALIKKQYRKFALLLHPDKNKFAGAEAAFKLIGEAQRVLLDNDKRSFYDMKYKTPYRPAATKQASHQVSKSFNIVRPQTVQNNSRNNRSHQEPKLKAQPAAANGKETFWTVCPFCSVRFQYYKQVLNRALRCQSCQKPFIAYDMHAQSARPGSAATHPVFPRQNVPNNVGASDVGPETMNKKPVCNPGSQSEQNAEFSRAHEAIKSHKRVDKVDEEEELESESSRKENRKRGKKQVIESSESFESDSSLDMDGIEINDDSVRAPRRSARSKRRVVYNESGSDDEVAENLPKRAKGSRSSSPVMEKHSVASGTEQLSDPFKPIGSGSASVKEETKGGSSKSVGGETVDEPIKKNFVADNGCISNSSPETTPEPTFHEYPDPEFCDFDKDREEHCFKVGQVWAAYDTVDAMPRFYARIRRIYSPGFKVRITWLEPDPDPDDEGVEWVNGELPFSCGKFKNGDSENTEDRLMFSHLVCWEKGSGRDSVMIYPRKGETWALFKYWDAKWYLIPENERKLEFEFVEVLSEYNEGMGIRVAHLGKLKGFASLFCRKGGNEVQIQPSEIRRFSHRVPSYRMTGNERKDVPPGSYELDPAALTMNLEETTLPKQDVKPCVVDLTSNFDEATPEKSASNYRNNGKGDKVGQANDLHGGVNGQYIPDPEFFNFDGVKSPHKLEVNQIWALYSDIDGLPKYYGLVKKIDPHPNFAVHVAWLEACHPPTDIILWKDKKIPISCGQFKVRGGKLQSYTVLSSFSHQLRVEADPKGRKNMFSIYPQEGDVWALYKNWCPDIARSTLKGTEYDIVEVLDTNPLHFKVLVLEPAQAFKAVFKPQEDGSLTVTREICRAELLRFSHRIPSFRLTDERGGKFRGFWELDPAALPDQFLYRKE